MRQRLKWSSLWNRPVEYCTDFWCRKDWKIDPEVLFSVLALCIIGGFALLRHHYCWSKTDASAVAETVFYLGAIIGLLAFLLLKHGLFPHLKVQIQLCEAKEGVLIVRLRVENVSELPASKQFAILQILDYNSSSKNMRLLSSQGPDPKASWGAQKPQAPPTSWVPRDPADPRAKNSGWDEPLARRTAFDVMDSTETFEPGEVITVELLYQPAKEADFVHGLFQVLAKQGWLARKVHRIIRGPKHTPQFSATAWARVNSGRDMSVRDRTERSAHGDTRVKG